MSRQTYLTFPDDFRDQLITQRTGFVPFPHQGTHNVQEFTGEQVRQTEPVIADTKQQVIN